MEQTNNAKARYIPTRVAVCKRCEGKGVVFEYSDENRTKGIRILPMSDLPRIRQSESDQLGDNHYKAVRSG